MKNTSSKTTILILTLAILMASLGEDVGISNNYSIAGFFIVLGAILSILKRLVQFKKINEEAALNSVRDSVNSKRDKIDEYQLRKEMLSSIEKKKILEDSLYKDYSNISLAGSYLNILIFKEALDLTDNLLLEQNLLIMHDLLDAKISKIRTQGSNYSDDLIIIYSKNELKILNEILYEFYFGFCSDS